MTASAAAGGPCRATAIGSATGRAIWSHAWAGRCLPQIYW